MCSGVQVWSGVWWGDDMCVSLAVCGLVVGSRLVTGLVFDTYDP